MGRADMKIAIYAHSSGGTGNYGDELYDFLKRNGFGDVVKIDFPFGKRSEKAIRFKRCKNGAEVSRFDSSIRFSSPALISYLKDFFYGIAYGFRFLRNTDVFFGTDNLLTVIGLFLKKIGMVKKVAHIVIDYSPVRYDSGIMNGLYFSFDKICLYRSDFVVSLNDKMIDSRIKDRKLDSARINRVIAPFGNHSGRRKEEAVRANGRKIAYFGEVSKNKGFELFVPIAKSLLAKGFRDFKFEIIGGGDVDLLKMEVEFNHMDNFFDIRGRIVDVEEIESELASCSIALAPYYPDDKNSFSYYADPGKVKFYLGCGLPIIITDVPPIAKELESCGCGMISRYDSDDFADKIIEMLGDEGRYRAYRDNSVRFGKRFGWDTVFGALLEKIL
jgi:glycosyltransferase involved in cell wall biosynthesis